MSAPPPLPLRLRIRMVAIAAFGCGASIMSGQIGGLTLSDAAGGLGVSADTASWLPTGFLAAQALSVPLAPLLTVAIGPRRVLLSAGASLVLASAVEAVGAGYCATLVARTVQGAAAGLFPIMTMLLVMRSFPPGGGQREGLLLFAAATSVGLGLAASAAGWLSITLGWTGPAIFQMAWAGLMVMAIYRSFPRQRPDTSPLRSADWPGYLALSGGCAAMVVALMQGERRFWLESEIVTAPLAVGAILLMLAAIRLRRAARPFVNLRLLALPTFGWAILMAVTLRFALLMVAFVVPQYLTRLQDFRVENLADVTIWILPAHLAAFPLAYLAARRVDPRMILMTGLLAFTGAAFLNTDLDPLWAAEQFRLSMLLLGGGQAFFVYALLLFATHGLGPADGPTAGTFFNLSRIVGQAFGTAFVATLVTTREKFHSNVLVETLSTAPDAAAAQLARSARGFASVTSDPALPSRQALAALQGRASDQAFVLAYLDAFLVLGGLLLVASFLAWMLPDIRAALPSDPAREVAP